MNYLSKAAVVLSCMGLISCGAIPEVTHQSQPTGATPQQLRSPQAKSLVCVVYPDDSAHGQEKYPGSGAEIGLRIQQAVEGAGWSTLTLKGDAAQATTGCLRRGGTHLLETVVAHYEDNNTGWSGKPDRIELQMRLSLVSQPASARIVSYEAKSNVAASAVLEWGNAKPVSLLKGDFDHLVKKLLRDVR